LRGLYVNTYENACTVRRPAAVKSMGYGDQSLSAISPGPYDGATRLGAGFFGARSVRMCFLTAV
jgi:hypothetical protein